MVVTGKKFNKLCFSGKGKGILLSFGGNG